MDTQQASMVCSVDLIAGVVAQLQERHLLAQSTHVKAIAASTYTVTDLAPFGANSCAA